MHTKSYFLSQPHQPFFLLGISNAIVAMLLFLLAYKGLIILSLPSNIFHIYSLAFLLFNNVFAGFLFTTFPRFNQAAVVPRDFYTKIFYANLSGSLLFYLGSISVLWLVIVAMVLLFVTQALSTLKLYSIYKEGRAPQKEDSFWILVANYFGLVGALLFIGVLAFSYDALQSSAIAVTFYLYLIFLAFSVAQRMVPFFSHSWAQKDPRFVPIVFGLFFLKSIAVAAALGSVELVVDTVLALYLLKEFLRWDLHPLQAPAILWVLHLALFWMPLAFGLAAMSDAATLFLENSFYFVNIHLLALGFLTTVLIGFGTRVALGHAGLPPAADKTIIGIFIAVQVVVLLRALVSLDVAFGWGFAPFFDMAATAWIAVFAAWGSKFAKILIFGKDR